MISVEMQDSRAKIAAAAPFRHNRFERADSPSDIERAFACQLAASVWLLQLGDDGAREGLFAYVKARHRNRQAQARLYAALESEYRLCRERLDLCS